MRIERSTSDKLRIVGAPLLDPIVVYVDEAGPGAGGITLTCYGKAWTAFWANHASANVPAFMAVASNDYVVNCLDRGIEAQIMDPHGARKNALGEVLRQRRARQLTKDQAYQQYWQLEELYIEDDPWRQPDVMQKLLGEDWVSAMPMMPNPDYVYLTRIVAAVREALVAEPPVSVGERIDG